MSKSSLIEEFYSTIQEKYTIGFEECQMICSSVFSFVKEKISVGEFKNIRLKYFGTFQVSSGRVKYYKEALENGYNKGSIDEVKYTEKINILNNYKKDK